MFQSEARVAPHSDSVGVDTPGRNDFDTNAPFFRIETPRQNRGLAHYLNILSDQATRWKWSSLVVGFTCRIALQWPLARELAVGKFTDDNWKTMEDFGAKVTVLTCNYFREL